MHRIVLNAPGSSEGSAKKSKVFFIIKAYMGTYSKKRW
jgi:hypothetical protein